MEKENNFHLDGIILKKVLRNVLKDCERVLFKDLKTQELQIIIMLSKGQKLNL